MSYRLGRNEPPAEELRRACLEEVDRARVLLRTAHVDSLALHEARKQLKKLRAALDLGSATFGRAGSGEARQLQAAARVLARHREFDALRILLERETRIAGSADFDFLETSLRLHHIAHGPTGNRARDIDAVRRSLWGTRRWLAVVPLDEISPVQCWRRLRKNYKAARSALAALREQRSVEAFHDLRKASKRCLNQSRLLRGWGNAEFTAFRKQLVALDDLLGRARDCGMLGEILRGVPAAEAPLRGGFGLRVYLERTAREAEAAAVVLTARLYRRPSRDFIARVVR